MAAPPDLRSEHNRLYAQAARLLEGQLSLHDQPLGSPGPAARERIRRAIALLQRVVEINPQNWAALWVAGKAHERLAEFDAALGLFAKAHEINPSQRDVAREAGLAAMNARRPDLAIGFTTKAIAADPNDAGLVANLALAHLFNGNPRSALELAEQALAKAPGDDITRRIVGLARDVLDGKRECPRHVSEV